MDVNELKSRIDKLVPENIGFMVYGSVIYKTNNQNSDIDVIALHKDKKEIVDGALTIHVISEEEFIRRLEHFDVVAVECFFSPLQNVVKDYSGFINWKELRKSFSKVASHSWSKAHKKIEIEKQYYIGKKSLFHCLRILIFAKQLSEFKNIVDFTEGNSLYFKIMNNPSLEWNDYKAEFKEVYNRLHSNFKIVDKK